MHDQQGSVALHRPFPFLVYIREKSWWWEAILKENPPVLTLFN
jgi:hypothetical protein